MTKRALSYCVAIALAGAAAAAGAPLALGDAQQLAIERSPQMGAYDASVAAWRGLSAAVRSSVSSPSTGAGATVVRPTERSGFGRSADTIARTGLAGQASSSLEVREAVAERYARDADRIAVQKAATRVDIARETALAWIECHYVEQMTRVAAEQLKFAQVELESTERMYWAGRVTQADFYVARSMLVSFEDRSGELEHRVRASRIALTRWTGDAGDQPLAELPDIDRIPLRPAALEGDLVRDPDVALLQQQENIAASDVRVARADRQSPAEIAVMLAKQDALRAAREEKLRSAVADMRIRIDEWQHARDRRDRYARQLVPLARERTQATLVAYRGSKAPLADVLAARRAEMEARMQAVETERDAARLWVRINFALPDGLPAATRATSRAEIAP